VKLRLHWGLGIAAVYTLFAASTVGVVAFAISQPVDLVSADYYARSLEHDAHRAATARADALGASLRCAVSQDATTLVLELPRDHAPSASGRMRLYRPSDGRADRIVSLHLDAHGSQHVALDGLSRGRWRLQLEWRASGLTYYHERSLDLR
jgi:nitrogen fixation protein FixH